MSKKRKNRLLWWILLLLLVGGAAGGGYYWKNGRAKPVSVQVQTAQLRNLTETVLANGRVQPVVQVKISPEVSGEIVELPVKEGDRVKKGQLLVKIKPDTYVAARNSEQARFKSAQANLELSGANLKKAEQEYHRHKELFESGLISDSEYLEYKTANDVANASLRASQHQVEVAQAALDRADEELSRTTIYAPIDGIIIKLNSELGERVVGTAMMTGTEIMIVADLNEMEARVDIGETDVVLIKLGQKARLEVEAFRDETFQGSVTEIANSSSALATTSQGGQEATRFEVRIRFEDKTAFRPGMSVTSYIETRYRTNVVTVPIQSVTTRNLNKDEDKDKDAAKEREKEAEEASRAAMARRGSPNPKEDKKNKPAEVVFVLREDRVKAMPVKMGISDDNYMEITEGLSEGDRVVTGSFKAISRDLKDDMKVEVKPETDLPSKEKEESS